MGHYECYLCFELFRYLFNYITYSFIAHSIKHINMPSIHIYIMDYPRYTLSCITKYLDFFRMDNMYKNIFITGNIKVGKSTLLNHVIKRLKGRFSGFKTLPTMIGELRSGFVIVPWTHNEKQLPDQYIAKHLADGNWVIFPNIFDTIGSKILEDCLDEKPNLIIMDELGFFESNSPIFQNKIIQCLDSPIPVLGVIKPMDNIFLNSIRNRKDVLVLEIDKDNRSEQCKLLEELLRKMIHLTNSGEHVSL